MYCNINSVYVCAPACLQVMAAPSLFTWTVASSPIVSKIWTHSPPTRSLSVQYTATRKGQKSPYLSSQVLNGSEVYFIYHDSSSDLNSSLQLCPIVIKWVGTAKFLIPCFIWLTSHVLWSSHFNHSSCLFHLYYVATELLSFYHCQRWCVTTSSKCQIYYTDKW